MNIAFLYNSDHESLGSWYGYSVMSRILEAQVLQNVNRHMRVSIGDVLTYSAAVRSSNPTEEYLLRLCRAVYRPKQFDYLLYDSLDKTHGKATVYCWLFQNMTEEIGKSLHEKLCLDPAYLGTMDVVFSAPLTSQLIA